MVGGFLHAEGRHERGTAVITAYHDLLHQITEVGKYQVPEPAVMALHHIRTVTLGLAVVVIFAGEECLVVRSQLAVPIVIGRVPDHAVPRTQKHVLCQLVHTQIKVNILVIGDQVRDIEILHRLLLESRALPFGRRELVAVIRVIHAGKGMGGRVILHPLAGLGLLGTCIDERHHTVYGLIHLVVLVAGTEVVFQIGFFFPVTATAGPEGVLGVVELKAAVEVGIHKVGMARFTGRQPMEQAQVVRVVECLDADRQVLLPSIPAGFQVIQGAAVAPGFRTDGIVLAEDRVTVALLVVHVVLAIIHQVVGCGLRNEQVARHTVYCGTNVIVHPVILGIPLRGSEQPHFLQAVMDEFRATGIGRHGRVREVALRAGQLRADGVLAQPEQVLLPFRRRRAALLPITVNLPVAHPGGVSTRRLLEIEAQVLSRIVHR